jgi:hypothetical protein
VKYLGYNIVHLSVPIRLAMFMSSVPEPALGS